MTDSKNNPKNKKCIQLIIEDYHNYKCSHLRRHYHLNVGIFANKLSRFYALIIPEDSFSVSPLINYSINQLRVHVEHKPAEKWAYSMLYAHASFHLAIFFFTKLYIQTCFHPVKTFPRCMQPTQRHLLPSHTDTLVYASAFTQKCHNTHNEAVSSNVTHLCLAFCPIFAVASVLAARIGFLWTGPKVLCGLNASHGSLFTVAN